MSDLPKDRISVVGMEVDCVIGINDWERVAKQRIEIDIVLHTDITAAGGSDHVDDTVNYRTVAHKVVSEVKGSSFRLVEALAEHIARTCLEYEGVQRVDISVRKPGAVRFAKFVSVEISRSRE